MSDQTETQTVTTQTATADAARLIRALSNVALFAGTDDTLPALLCLHLSTADGTLTVEATDRYVLAQETVPDSPGTLDVLVSAKDTLTAVKPIAAALKANARLTGYMASKPTVTITLDGAWVRLTLADNLAPDQTVTVPVTDAQFPRDRSWDDYGKGSDGTVAFNAAYLARLAKVDDGEQAKYRYVRFALSAPARPAVVHVGETFRALVMPVRPAGS